MNEKKAQPPLPPPPSCAALVLVLAGAGASVPVEPPFSSAPVLWKRVSLFLVFTNFFRLVL